MSKKSVFLSIIVPVFNRENYIGRCLKSVFEAARRVNFSVELVVIDDGSTDGSVRVIESLFEEFRRHSLPNFMFRLIVLDENHGVNFARNRGIEIADSEFTIFLDSDNYFFEDAFLKVWRWINKISADLYLFSTVSASTGKVMDKVFPKNRNVTYHEYLCHFSGELTTVIRTDILKKYPLFEKINGGEGVYWTLLLKKGFKAYLVDDVIKIYDETPPNRLSSRKKNFRRLAKVYGFYLKYLLLEYLLHCPVKAFLVVSKFVFYSVFQIVFSIGSFMKKGSNHA